MELFRFFRVNQALFTEFSGFRIHECNLLEARMIVATYNQHVRLLSPSPLVVSASKVYSSLGAGIVYGIITLVERF